MSKGLLVVLSGPSGVGKGTIVKELLKKYPDTSLSVSCTTRAPRDGEKDGVNYFFVSKEYFENTIKEGGFLEFSNHFENYYGTPKAFVEKRLEKGDVVLEIEVDGALSVKSVYPAALLIMVTPPSKEELIRRLRGRGTEDEEVIARRIARAEYELSFADRYDYTVVNDRLNDAVEEIARIIENTRKELIK